MTANAEIFATLARSLGILPARVKAMARALGMAPAGQATIPGTVRLLIALLAADRPDQALKRADIYGALPFTHDTRTAPMPDGTMIATTWDTADIRPPAGKGEVFERVARSLAGCLERFIELMIARDPAVLTPYLIRFSRRDFAPLVIVCARLADQGEEVMLFRRSGDEESDYWMALGKLTIFAEASGSVLEALADLFREEAVEDSAAATVAARRERARV